jgi:hypothetical protein
MAICDEKWFECWYDGDHDLIPVYILFVKPATDTLGGFVVIDWQKNKEIIFRGRTYEEVVDWLSADEYEQIEGRIFVDDGWQV